MHGQTNIKPDEKTPEMKTYLVQVINNGQKMEAVE
jgi:hypothetical protein